jgi:hypothetical protein
LIPRPASFQVARGRVSRGAIPSHRVAFLRGNDKQFGYHETTLRDDESNDVDNDSTETNWLDFVKGRFGLIDFEVTPEFTEHERMLGDDPEVLQEALGIPLDLNRTV